MRKIPKEVKGLWNVQYVPRERILKKHFLSPKASKLWGKLPYNKKIKIIDEGQARGDFDEFLR